MCFTLNLATSTSSYLVIITPQDSENSHSKHHLQPPKRPQKPCRRSILPPTPRTPLFLLRRHLYFNFPLHLPLLSCPLRRQRRRRRRRRCTKTCPPDIKPLPRIWRSRPSLSLTRAGQSRGTVPSGATRFEAIAWWVGGGEALWKGCGGEVELEGCRAGVCDLDPGRGLMGGLGYPGDA
jgi:hypothetical protein